MDSLLIAGRKILFYADKLSPNSAADFITPPASVMAPSRLFRARPEDFRTGLATINHYNS